MRGPLAAAAPPATASGGPRPTPTYSPIAGLAFGVIAAASALAAGAGLVGAGVAWAPSRSEAQAILQGSRIYAAECAGCHGARLEGWTASMPPDVRGPSPAPPLDSTGHAWRHSDAELAGIVAHGTKDGDLPGSKSGMPAFAEQLDRNEINAVLAYVRSHWPANVRALQATQNPSGELALGALLRDPTWAFPAQCFPPPAAPDGL